MKYISNILGGLLGALFVMIGVMFFFKLMPDVKMTPDTPPDYFMRAVGPTGFMSYVKAFELLGGLLVAFPRTRNFGLLVLGPIILNIVAYHAFIMGGKTLADPMLIGICLVALYLLWDGRREFGGLVINRNPKA